LAYYTNGRADQEQNDPNVRPAISGGVENMNEYDTIILGYPIWHGQAPRIISTFLESYDFSGKMIVPFCTSHSSGIGSSASNLHSLCAESVEWRDGKRFESGVSKESVQKWIEEIGIE
jgi:flavodoxin